MSQHPVFAVVGHPNKGKSTVVSTLAYDDSVQISNTPGTTTKARSFPMRVDNNVLYELIDTPGFQRARQVLTWLNLNKYSADQRPIRIQEFVTAHATDPKFNDEVELLRPIVEQKAGILYVVDGSQPYGPEYETEMEILRASGQPSMALINMIGANDYSADWQKALGQYFRLVRVFNPMKANFLNHLRLLEAIAQLNPNWTDTIKEAIRVLQDDRDKRLRRTANLIAQCISDMLIYREHQKIGGEQASESEQSKSENAYAEHMTRREQKCRTNVETTWRHARLLRDEEVLKLATAELFSLESWSAFGLSRQQLILTAVAGGAAVGTGVDLALGGASLLLGTGIGAIVGGVSALIGYDQILNTKVLGLPLGGHEIVVGPMKNLNFPWVLLGRAMLHASELINRPHAQRGALNLNHDESLTEKWTDNISRKNFERQFAMIRKNAPKAPSTTTINGLTDQIYELLLRIENGETE